MTQVPDVLARNAVRAWGDDGRRWLAALPRVLADVAARWELELGPPYDLMFHWVCRVRRSDGSAAVLKLGPPEPGHLGNQADALRGYDGAGAVRLLAYDEQQGALLLEPRL